VLVVDDELEFAILMNDVLATLPEPLNVEIAGNGRDAVEAVRRAAPDLVMLDVNMPVMNGLDALRHIRELDPKLPVVLVTATDCHSIAEGCWSVSSATSRSPSISATSPTSWTWR